MSAGRKYRRQMHRTLVITPEIPDDAPTWLKNGLAIRNAATTTGTCPSCGAHVELDEPLRPGQVTQCRMAHDDRCPALPEVDR